MRKNPHRFAKDIDLKRAWWTPPLSPKQAWLTEKNQIEPDLFPYWRSQSAGLRRAFPDAAHATPIPPPFLSSTTPCGLRPWAENHSVAALAKACQVPLVSGGDRHAREPNAHYRQNFKVRIIQNMCEVLRDDPGHSLGSGRWSDRIFYLFTDDKERSLTTLFGNKVPAVIDRFIGLMRLVQEGWLRSALRFALPRKEEPAL